MMIQSILVLLLIFIANVQLLSISDRANRKIEWNTLKLRWGPDPLVSNDEVYIRQPRTVQQALQEQYEQLPDTLEKQCIGETTIGYRYWKGNDTAAILIFDKQGIIAGIQIAFRRSSIKGNYYSFDTQKMFNVEMINGIEMYTLTAYFIDPTLICTVGRTLSQLEHEGTGTGLFLQNGTNPIKDSIEIPLWEKDIGKTKWVKGGCFKTMGIHYWYDNRLDKSCSDFFPSFLMYNKGQLSGFGWNIVANLNFSRRIERVLTPVISTFLIPVPTCIPKVNDELGGFTTQHLYFNTDPANLEC
ncbi:unnamed protein product [Rotaria sordida]|uniref:Uncharacterized protein n=1 Tax=Rotaria sordida TaxID=392033 RepID=A0A813XFA8_9BILA|nr:unnamed protein product [Rotaria sordida]